MAKRATPEGKKMSSKPHPRQEPKASRIVPLYPSESLETEHIQLQVENQQLRETQALLEHSREWLATLFSQAPVAYIVLDPVGLIQEANLQATGLLGRSSDLLSFCSLRQFITDEDSPKFISHLERCRHTEGEEVTTSVTLDTMPPRFVELRSRAIRPIMKGGIVYQTAIIDHTALTTAQKELSESKERYRLLFNAVTEMFALVKAVRDEHRKIVDFQIVEVNAAWKKYTGVASSHTVGESLYQSLPQIRDEWHSVLSEIADTGIAVKKQMKSALRDKWFILSAYKVLKDQVAILLLDITERKRSEEAIKQSEQEYRLLFEENPVAMWIFDTDTLEILQVNDAALAQYGYTRKELLGLCVSDLVVPEQRQPLREAIRRNDPLVVTGGIWKHMRKDGARIHVEIITHDLSPAGRRTRIVHAANVTARVQAEEALRQSEEFNRRIIESSTDCIKILDIEGRFLSISASGQRLLEIDDLTPYINRNWGEFWREADQPKVAAALSAARAGGTGRFSAFRPTLKGTPKWWDVIVTAITDESGEPEQLLVVTRDVTDRMEAEEKLRQREERLSFHMENSPLAVIEWDGGYIVTTWSSAAERIFGWTADECLGKDIAALNMVYPEDTSIVMRTMERLSSGKEKSVVSENRNVTKDGRVINCLWHNSVLTDSQGNMTSVLSLVEDVTAARKATDTLKKALNSLNALVSNSNESMVLANAEGKVVRASERAANVLGYRPEELEGKHWSEILAREHFMLARFHFADFVRNGSEQASATLKLRTANGQDAWCALQVSLVSLGSEDGYLIHMERVSEEQSTGASN